MWKLQVHIQHFRMVVNGGYDAINKTLNFLQREGCRYEERLQKIT